MTQPFFFSAVLILPIRSCIVGTPDKENSSLVPRRNQSVPTAFDGRVCLIIEEDKAEKKSPRMAFERLMRSAL